jgi:hypothetical protein
MNVRSRLRKLEDSGPAGCSHDEALLRLLERIIRDTELEEPTHTHEPIYCEDCGRLVEKLTLDFFDRIRAEADERDGSSGEGKGVS